MLLTLYIFYNVIGWLFLLAGMFFGIFRKNLPGGKAMVVVMFGVAMVVNLMLAPNSFFIEVPGCTSTACASTQYVYDYLAWIHYVLAALSSVMALLMALLSFGDLVPAKR